MAIEVTRERVREIRTERPSAKPAIVKEKLDRAERIQRAPLRETEKPLIAPNVHLRSFFGNVAEAAKTKLKQHALLNECEQLARGVVPDFELDLWLALQRAGVTGGTSHNHLAMMTLRLPEVRRLYQPFLEWMREKQPELADKANAALAQSALSLKDVMVVAGDFVKDDGALWMDEGALVFPTHRELDLEYFTRVRPLRMYPIGIVAEPTLADRTMYTLFEFANHDYGHAVISHRHDKYDSFFLPGLATVRDELEALRELHAKGPAPNEIEKHFNAWHEYGKTVQETQHLPDHTESFTVGALQWVAQVRGSEANGGYLAAVAGRTMSPDIAEKRAAYRILVAQLDGATRLIGRLDGVTPVFSGTTPDSQSQRLVFLSALMDRLRGETNEETQHDMRDLIRRIAAIALEVGPTVAERKQIMAIVREAKTEGLVETTQKFVRALDNTIVAAQASAAERADAYGDFMTSFSSSVQLRRVKHPARPSLLRQAAMAVQATATNEWLRLRPSDLRFFAKIGYELDGREYIARLDALMLSDDRSIQAEAVQVFAHDMFAKLSWGTWKRLSKAALLPSGTSAVSERLRVLLVQALATEAAQTRDTARAVALRETLVRVAAMSLTCNPSASARAKIEKAVRVSNVQGEMNLARQFIHALDRELDAAGASGAERDRIYADAFFAQEAAPFDRDVFTGAKYVVRGLPLSAADAAKDANRKALFVGEKDFLDRSDRQAFAAASTPWFERLEQPLGTRLLKVLRRTYAALQFSPDAPANPA